MSDNLRNPVLKLSAGKKYPMEETAHKRSSDRKSTKIQPPQNSKRIWPPVLPNIKIAPKELTDRNDKQNITSETLSAQRRNPNCKSKGKMKGDIEPSANLNPSANFTTTGVLSVTSVQNSTVCQSHLSNTSTIHLPPSTPPSSATTNASPTIPSQNNWICGIPLVIQSLHEVTESMEVSMSDRIQEKKIQEEVQEEVPEDLNSSSTIQVKTLIADRWRKGQLIGSGSTSDVYRMLDVNTGIIAAGKNIKRFQNDDLEVMANIKSQLQILCGLQHNNIVKFYDYVEIPQQIWFFMEYIPDTLEMSYLNYGAICLKNAKQLTKQLLQAVRYLHQNKIIHKDIKCSNILISSQGNIKLGDFGSSKRFDQTNSVDAAMTFKGSVCWMAPQVIISGNHRRKSDIWSVGCTVIQMLTAKRPWSEKGYDNQMAAIRQIGTSNQIPHIPDDLPKQWKDFLLRCLVRDPQERASADQLLKSSFFNQ